MHATVHSAALLGAQATPVEVQVDLSLGLPGFFVVGLPGLLLWGVTNLATWGPQREEMRVLHARDWLPSLEVETVWNAFIEGWNSRPDNTFTELS